MTDRIEITLTPGLEQDIRRLASLTFGEDSAEEPIERVIELLLPELISNALAGDYVPSDAESPADQEGSEEIQAAIAEAERESENMDVSVPLTHDPQEPAEEVEAELPDIDTLEAAGVNQAAVAWARGTPLREKALAQTCINLPRPLWDGQKVLELAERTYGFLIARSDV